MGRSKTHRPNGPYLPVGDLGGEYCVRCRTAWPCPESEKTVGIPTENGEQVSEKTDEMYRHFYAKVNGYFWLPCKFPGCGRMFGGHEYGDYNIQDRDDMCLSTMTCDRHNQFAALMFQLRIGPREINYWSSSGRLNYRGFPEEDIEYCRVRDIPLPFNERDWM